VVCQVRVYWWAREWDCDPAEGDRFFPGVCEIVGPLCEWPPGTESGVSCVPFSVHLTSTSNNKHSSDMSRHTDYPFTQNFY